MTPSPIVGNTGFLVHLLAYSVSFEFADDGETERLSVRLHRVSDIACAIACHGSLDSLVQGCLGDIQELPGFGIHLPDREGVSRITVVAFVQGSAVYGNDVTFFERAVGRKTVHDYIVYAHAESCREAIETFEGRNGTMITDEGLGHLIQLRSCHTWGDQLTNLGQGTGHQVTVDPEQFDFFFSLRPEHIVLLYTFKNYMPERPVRRPVFMSPS